MTKTLITGGTVISATGSHRADVLVENETICALLAPDSVQPQDDITAAGITTAVGITVDHIIDARGKYVIPGGVDAHTHMEMPFGGTSAADTFTTGTRAAAIGGTTTIIDFVVQYEGQRVLDQFALWHEKAAGNCAIDYGFHQILSAVDTESLHAMDELIAEGVTSFKLFMAYKGVFLSDDGQILRAFQRGAENGALMMMHAENGAIIDVLVQQALAAGHTSPLYHGLTRPWQTEEEATHRAIMLADLTGAPLYVVHVSAKQAVAQIAAARSRGMNVFGETCPQYLYLSLEDHLGAPGFEGAKWVASTPLRSKHEGHHDALWHSLRSNDLQLVSTDHCPFCMSGQKELGVDNFSLIPNGMATVEHRLDLMYQGVVAGKITKERWVELTSTTPARMFGLYGKKGVIQPGADADIVIYNPAGQTRIGMPTNAHGNPTGRQHHMNTDHSTWEGFDIDGSVELVLSRGVTVASNGEYCGRIGHGRYVPRQLTQYLNSQ